NRRIPDNARITAHSVLALVAFKNHSAPHPGPQHRKPVGFLLRLVGVPALLLREDQAGQEQTRNVKTNKGCGSRFPSFEALHVLFTGASWFFTLARLRDSRE